ncbi:hypothetical protein LTS02_010492 [Friedmanniomyces endolithicus]|uniref:AMMECR1 domain-containing protein n=1 Tax=Friedmanniomyces endolithicus TaxID=329885 RepID=A0A4U0UUG1_9PEZI|nr:hypothetical protein LTS09_008128 [Friedmanniomyces endolithicus]KAK0856674.1 hypothetical protein LTS02_010492 [Friedmanniomyces endolithicus]KAK0871252.1 hypothetical protein LTR87_012933 [Friedmanniomyces endolithicus]TKA39680.1 hypothetical protein B0A54_08317 [Friedmanniomyces endolithicus]
MRPLTPRPVPDHDLPTAANAHCAYAFECLVASFEHRQPLSLAQVDELWVQYRGSKIDDRHIDGDGAEQDDGESDADEGAEMDEPVAARPAAVSRLLTMDDAASAGSSNSSLPLSTRSVASSTPSSRGKGSGAGTPASSRSSQASVGRSGGREEYPLFVTWNTTSRSGHKSLRGCIGTFEPQELEYGLRSYALTSAFEDVRFSPIPASLLPSLSAHITLLTNFSQPTKDPLDWTLGTHGIRISFSVHGRRYGATYLPDVAQEQGWSKEETLVSLMRKGGWSGSSSRWLSTWREGKGELVRYEGKAVGLHYGEWRDWREWATAGTGVRSQGLK